MNPFFLANVTHFVEGLLTAKKLKPDEVKEIVRVASEKSEGGKVPLITNMLDSIFQLHPNLIKIFMGELEWNKGQQRILRERQQACFILKK